MSELTPHTGIDKKELALGVVVWDHGTERDVNAARASINLEEDRFYPGDAYACNQEATLHLFVINGRGTVVFKDGREFDLSAYDKLTIPNKTPYRYTRCIGFNALMISANPPWTADQYSEVNLD